MYENHIGLPQDDKGAANYYRLAANQGYTLAQCHLAALFEAGRGVHRDYKQALAWYRKAADQNLADAEEEVGYFYQSGLGVKRDYAQALSWYCRDADHGSSNAENQLGYMAEEGWGQPQNYAEALSRYDRAAEQGNGQAQENIGYMFQHGTACPRIRSPQGNRHMRRLLNQSANAAARTKGSIFEIVYRRSVPRLGHNQAIGAIAHRQCRLIWLILHKGVRYEERGPAVTKRAKQKRTARMIRQLRNLGYRIELPDPQLPTQAR